MVKHPVAAPAAPTPAIARPTMKVVGPWATAHIRLPSSKTNMVPRKDIFKGKYLKNLPDADWKPPKVMKYADPYCNLLASGP